MENNTNEATVGNFQIQYFPNAAKDKLDEIASRNKISRRELFVLIADNAEAVEEFLKKRKVLIPRP